MAQIAHVGDELLRRLAGVDADGGRVISLYLGLDPSEFGTQPARASAIRSVLDEADREVRAIDGLSHDANTALREDLESLKAFFDTDFSAEGLHGLAAFASSPVSLFTVVPLLRAPSSQVAVDLSPHLAPLVETSDEERWLVLLVSRRDAYILRGSTDRLQPLAAWADDVHGKHDQGGWSQARYQRSVEHDVDAHVSDVTARLAEIPARARHDHLLVACAAELWPRVEARLDAASRHRLAGHLDREIRAAGPQQVLEDVRPLMEETERRHEDEALQRLRDGIAAPGGHGIGGLGAVLEALVEERVDVLLTAPQLHAAGVLCRTCGWMGEPGPTSCPVDGSPLLQRADIIEDAVAQAIRSDAQTLVVRDREDLGPLGGIAAILRF